jgi:hypothetical protein
MSLWVFLRKPWSSAWAGAAVAMNAAVHANSQDKLREVASHTFAEFDLTARDRLAPRHRVTTATACQATVSP